MPLTRCIEKYDRRLAGILAAAAGVFADRGYDRASIRMVAECAGVSVPGLYYYVRSKEELLFHIQMHVFSTLVERQRAGGRQGERPEDRLRRLVAGHLAFFLEHMAELVVCAREVDRLRGESRQQVEAKQREYFGLAVRIFDDLCTERRGRGSGGPSSRGTGIAPRTAALALFGTINWIHTWYRPERGPAGDKLAEEVVDLYLHGAGAREQVGMRARASARSQAGAGTRVDAPSGANREAGASGGTAVRSEVGRCGEAGGRRRHRGARPVGSRSR